MLHLVLNTCSGRSQRGTRSVSRGHLMSVINRFRSLLLVSLMILASWAPLAAAGNDDSGENPTTQGGISTISMNLIL
jgi:hypothetical protein